MQIVVAGLGKVGSYLAGELSQEGHDVQVVDIDPEHVRAVTSQYDVMGLNGSIVDPETLEELDLEDVDLFIAVAASDEINLLACLFAKKGGCSKTIARVRSPEYKGSMEYLKHQLGLEMIINPEQLAAAEIDRIVAFPSAIDVDTFAKGEAEIIKFRLSSGSMLDGMAVKEIPMRLNSDILVVVVQRDGKVHIPDGDFVLQDKDVVYIAANRQAAMEFLRDSGSANAPIRKAMLVGAGKLAYYLAERLVSHGVEVTVIDHDLKACERFAQLNPKAIVINGDGSDPNLLLEEGLEQMDVFIALTGIDEENVFLSLYASKKGHMKTITKVTRIAFDDLIRDLELDTMINPKSLTAEYIIRYARSLANTMGSNVETMHKLAENQVEAVEFTVHNGCEVLNTPLVDLPIRPGVLIASIMRDGKMIVPRGHDVLKTGDSVVVITNQPGFVDITDILKKGRSRYE